MKVALVKGEVVNIKRAIVPFQVGDWSATLSYDHDDVALTSAIIVDARHVSGANFRLQKDQNNTNFNFNAIEPDLELLALIYNEVADIISRFSLSKT